MKQKEIWLVNLDPAIGAEIKKTRPCVILNDNAIGVLPLKIIAPITDHKPKFVKVPWMITIEVDKQNNLQKKSVIDVFQVRSISQQRLVKKIGEIKQDHLQEIFIALRVVFGME